jgi:hypothetical protein
MKIINLRGRVVLDVSTDGQSIGRLHHDFIDRGDRTGS